MTAHSAATLYQRYLARCHTDAAAALSLACGAAGVAPPGSGLWVAPAQRQARQVLPTLASRWADHLARPSAAPAAPNASAPQPFAGAGFGVPSGLGLMSDDDVDEDIESTRVVQAIESAAEWPLRDLRSRLASAPPAPGGARDEALPLAPAKIVRALCAALHDEPLDAPVRLAALRIVAEPLARALANLYQQHAELLAEWGLQPARYTIRREPETRAAARAPAAAAAVAGSPAPVAAGGAVGIAARQIPALLSQVAGEAGLSPAMQSLMGRLAGPVARSVAANPRLLDSVDNPLWRLIDRLAALGQLDTEGAPGDFQLPLHLRLEPIIARLESAAQPMPAERYAQALADAESEAGIAADTTRPAPAEPTAPLPLAAAAGAPGAPPPGPSPFNESALAAAERHRTLEPLVRQQMVARLRDSEVLPEVKQFLLGPWLVAVLHEVVTHGEESPGAQRVLRAVESLIEAGGYQRRGPLTRAELDCLRMEAEDGLAAAGLAAPRIRQHVQDLAAALAVWPRPQPDTAISPEEGLLPDEEELAGAELPDWPSHHELATVPIALDAHNPDERSLRDCEAWLDGLAVGDVCRIQRQGQWDTLRLNWRSDNGTYFAFGNSSGLAFCASRRVLGRMRLEGLATTMARGQWVRQAVDTLPMPLE
ncbi:DUF1631 family protein [Ideonella sp.]|uniref:DUF1631 family protein n=1 Tax=Ideonella sp. TaxID=1929293 RepID=UPI002B46F694|nr:DUF1631 family protein [Ideonella sp.]HJV71376.1 DUF1631 family protein [Ideonella sp.]